MKIDRVSLNVCLSLALAGLAGCSITTTLPRTESAVKTLEFRFIDPVSEQELVKMGLMGTFKIYWQAHKDRNWSLRYSLENLKQSPSEKFYVAYYERAWPLKSVVVRNVTPGTQTASVGIVLTLTNPETSEASVFEANEVWTLVEDKWRHEVSDPLLTGTKQ